MTFSISIEDSIKKEIENNLSSISNILENKWQDNSLLGLLTGNCSIALYYYYALFLKSDYYHKIANDITDNILERCTKEKIGDSYCNGLTGIGWFINFLIDNNFIDGDKKELFTDIDEMVFNYAEQKIEA